ncbi:MAG TPA: hypothetical protein VEX66_07590 [Microlunatus sp.]|nr:hypothetical protein [Microlunatus sp.]
MGDSRGASEGGGWSRAEEAARRAELAAGAERAESVKAQELIDVFLRDAAAAGIAPEPLRATLYTGQSVKTDKRGWYLRKNQSVAVGEDGGYYILTVPGGLKERLRGVQLRKSAPPLIVGKGGRDGETGDLAEFLARRLAQG